MNEFLDIFMEAGVDTLKLIPFLFLTYILMEWIEHRTGSHTQAAILRAGKAGPVPAWTIIKILAVKMVMGILFGFLLDFLYHSIWGRKMRYRNIHTMCESEHCKCDDEGIFSSALRHTIHITIFLFLITLVLEAVIDGVGEEALAGFLMDRPVLGEILAGAIGMVPNCASSVVITQLYLQKVISAGPMMAGLFTNAGVGALVLCRMNRKHVKQNVGILCYLYVAGVIGGILIDLLGINF